MNQQRQEIATEASRITDRLDAMPIARADARVQELVRHAAQQIVDLTPDPARPPQAQVPLVRPSALGSQIAVVVRDYLKMTTAASTDAAVAKLVTDLRRSLP